MPDPFIHALVVQGRQLDLETLWLRPERQERPLIVFLHEGLGSLSQWKDFPHRLCDATNCRGLVFSRPGYGHSTPRTAPWPQDYLQGQARQLLPCYLDSLGLQDEPLLLFGHSDGASLALLFAACFPQRVRALVAMAPHLFVEPVTMEGLRAAKAAYEQARSPLRAALSRHHADTDSAFYGWNDAWLRPGFEGQWNIEAELRGRLACPVLAVQGVGDEYATLAQIDAIQRLHPATELLALEQCGHSPQRDQPEEVIARCTQFFMENCR